jgi:hypothetical protein
VRWAETRPVGSGAVCLICGERRRENLRLVEYQGSWIPMCHNCGTRAMRLTPMPPSLEAIRRSLGRERRWADRREGRSDSRILQKERRVGERRLTSTAQPGEWLDAADLVIEIIELEDPEAACAEATRIMPRDEAARPPVPLPLVAPQVSSSVDG